MINSFKIIRDLKPGRVFLVEDKKGEKFVLKQNPVAPQLAKFSSLVHQGGRELGELMPTFFAKGNWFWQTFLPWSLAGDTVKTYGIKSSSFEHIDGEKLGRAIGQLQKLATGNWNLEIRRSDFYLKNIEEFKPALTEEFGTDFVVGVEQFLKSNQNLVDKYSQFLANGDLHPQNLMYSGSEFKIVDWDLLHFNNPGWDLCDLYVWGWRNSSWQDRLLNEYKKITRTPISDFKKIFAFDAVYLASQLIKHAKLINAPSDFLEAQKKLLLTYLA